MTPPKNGFSKGEATKRNGDRDNQYDGNRSRRLDIHHGDKKIKMNAKSIASQADRDLALTERCQKFKCAKIL